MEMLGRRDADDVEMMTSFDVAAEEKYISIVIYKLWTSSAL